MRWPIRWAALLLFTAALPACSEESDPEGELDPGQDSGPEGDVGSTIEIEVVANGLAGLLCEARAACDCESVGSAADCASEIMPTVAGGVARGQVLGLRYHEECLEPTTAHLGELGCRRFDETQADAELAAMKFAAARCKVVAGADRIGEPCQPVPGELGPAYLGDSCAQGLLCEQGVCVQLVEEVGGVCVGSALCPPGNACLDPEATGVPTCQAPTSEGERCNPHEPAACGLDLVCSADGGVCAPAPGAGEACPDGLCASGSLCDGAVCVASPGDGEPCGLFGCASGLVCDPKTVECAPLPVTGEPCAVGACALGATCGPEGVCVEDPPLLCGLPFCRYRFDGLCDEPEGTGLCADDTDPEDCVEPIPVPPPPAHIRG